MTLARRAVAWVVLALAVAAAWPGPAAAATSDAAARAWYRQVVDDLRPLQSTLLGALNAASGWQNGSESATTAGRAFARDLPGLQRVQRALENLAPLEGHAAAHDDYVSAIGLYVASLQVDEAAAQEPSGALQTQLQHSYERIRELGDIVFDQGTAELAPELGPGVAGPDVAAASHVPDWSAAAIAPALPLASSWPSGGAPSTGSQTLAAWSAEVGMDGAPAQATVRNALVGRPRQSKLLPMVTALGAAEAYVEGVPGPAGDPLASNRLRLGLLVDAEALMSGEAARLSHGAAARTLTATGVNLGSVGGRLRAES